MKRIRIVLFSIIFVFSMALISGGCAPKEFEPYEPPEIEFEETEKYEPDFSELEKPDKPDFIFLDEDFEVVEDKSKAKYAALDNDELKKVLQLSDLFNSQEDVIEKQTELVNIKIDQVNSLKELLEMKQYQTEQYVSLYAQARNQYLQERYDHKMDSFLYKSSTFLVTIGSVTLAILAL